MEQNETITIVESILQSLNLAEKHKWILFFVFSIGVGGIINELVYYFGEKMRDCSLKIEKNNQISIYLTKKRISPNRQLSCLPSVPAGQLQ